MPSYDSYERAVRWERGGKRCVKWPLNEESPYTVEGRS